MRRLLLASGLLAALSSFAASRPVLQVSVDPPHVKNGELVKFKVLVRYEGNAPVRGPRLPETPAWRAINNFTSQNVNSVLASGRIVTRYEYEYTWILKPLQKGTLTIPAMDLYVGTTHYQTEAVAVKVDRVSETTAAPPTGANEPEEEDDPWAGAMPRGRNAPPAPNMTADAPANQAFFVRAETSRTNVYQGELITLSYVLYERTPSTANPEIAKFPDFKGFLKEELSVPKTLTRTPVEIDGRTYYRSELIRYAVFPLRSGKLKIEPLVFKADFISNPMDEALQGLMNGMMPNLGNGFGRAIPMRKSTQAVNVEAKPLPAAPSGANFTGGVGSFRMDLKGSSGDKHVDQPFTITLTIAGTGNVKVIEEPRLNLPPSIEPYQTKPSYEFREDASGTKTFEYLLLPRQAGRFEMAPIEWTYFDTEKGRYETLKTQGLQIDVGAAVAGGDAASGTADAKPKKEAPATWSAIDLGAQSFVPKGRIGESGPLGGSIALAVVAVLYGALATVYTVRRRIRQSETLFANAPWEKTSRLILSKSSWTKAEIANLLDQWIRERLAGHLKDPSLHNEAARDDLVASLKSKMHPEHYRQIDPLKDFWGELDSLRFTGRASTDTVNPKPLLSKAKALIDPLLKASKEST